jgi:hypothetical protein
VNNPFDIKENGGHALDFALHLSPFSSLGEFGIFHSNAYVRSKLSSRFTKFNAHSLSDPL